MHCGARHGASESQSPERATPPSVSSEFWSSTEGNQDGFDLPIPLNPVPTLILPPSTTLVLVLVLVSHLLLPYITITGHL